MLFSPDIDILSRILLPLAGPEEFDMDDMEKLPDDLQYLPPDKKREEDPDIRIMLLETLMMVSYKYFYRTYSIYKIKSLFTNEISLKIFTSIFTFNFLNSIDFS